jgi:fumarate reductase iron-sulfur subunit
MTTLRVFRWSPGAPERWQTYTVEAGADTTVLDALVDVQRRQDPTLAFRYACRVGMCGSCAMVVDGRERWACRWTGIAPTSSTFERTTTSRRI